MDSTTTDDIDTKLINIIDGLYTMLGADNTTGSTIIPTKENINIEIKKLNSNNKNFIIEQFNKLVEIDTSLQSELTNFNIEPTRTETFFKKIFRLHRNILLLFLKENIVDSSKEINKLLKLSEDKLNIISDIISNNLDDSGIATTSTSGTSLRTKPSTQAIADLTEISRQLGTPGGDDIVIANKLMNDMITDLGVSELLGGKSINNILIGGGNHDIFKLFFKLKNLYNIFNSYVMLSLITLLPYKKEFDSLKAIDSKINIIEIINNLFIKIDDYPNITNIFNDKTNVLFNKQLDRDTSIYNIYNPTDNKYIFSYTILNNIYKDIIREPQNMDRYIGNIPILSEFILLYKTLLIKIKEIKQYYDIILKKNPSFKEAITKIINSKKKIYTFVKIRQDDDVANPIFNVKISTEKFINIKYINNEEFASTGTGTVSNNIEYYMLGPYDDIFLKNYNNKNIIETDKIKYLINKLIVEKEDMIMITYGQSGSGKTSTFIYLEKKGNKSAENGIIMLFFENKVFVQHIKRISIFIYEIYVYHNTDISPDPDNIYFKKNILFEKINFIYSNSNWIILDTDNIISSLNTNLKLSDDKHIKDTTPISEFINIVFDNNKITEPTKNNHNSSRSHIIIKCELYDNIDTTSTSTTPKPINFVICDFAGIEDKFECNKIEEIKNFYEKYSTSNKYKDNVKKIKYDEYPCIDDFPSPLKSKKEECMKSFNISDSICLPNYNMTYINEYLGLDKKTLKGGMPPKTQPSPPKGNIPAKITGPRPKPKPAASTASATAPAAAAPVASATTVALAPVASVAQPDFITIKNTDNYIKFLEYKISYEPLITEILTFNPSLIESAFEYIILQKVKHSNNISDFIKIYNEIFDNIILDKYQKKISDTYNITDFNNIFINKENKYFICNFEAKSKFFEVNSTRFEITKELTKIIDSKSTDKEKSNNLYENIKKHLISDTGNLIETPKYFEKEVVKLYKDYEIDNIKNKNGYLCELNIIKKIKYNCNLRVNEGYVINFFLKQIMSDINDLNKSLSKITLDTKLTQPTQPKVDEPKMVYPIFYEKDKFPYCRSNYLNNDYFDASFNKNKKKGYFFGLLEDIGINIKSTNIIIFTLINLSKSVNKPPNPPYINLINISNYNKEIDDNIIKKYTDGDGDDDINIDIIQKTIIKDKLKLIDTTLQNYNFYTSMIPKILLNLEELNNNDLVLRIDDIINTIRNNNSLTLIGSLEATTNYQEIHTDNICSYNENHTQKDYHTFTLYNTPPPNANILPYLQGLFPTSK